jgi:hypothetical protein
MYTNVNDENILRLIKAISEQNGEVLERDVYDLETSLIRVSRFPNHLFTSLLEVIKRRDYLEMKGSWYLLRIFQNKWDYLSEQQRDLLLPALEVAYRDLRDWMACFVIAEILGRLVKDERALLSLRRLRSVESSTARSLVPHGMELIIRGSQDRSLAERALAEILDMQNDPADEVKNEVRLSLARLAKAGWSISS